MRLEIAKPLMMYLVKIKIEFIGLQSLFLHFTWPDGFCITHEVNMGELMIWNKDEIAMLNSDKHQNETVQFKRNLRKC